MWDLHKPCLTRSELIRLSKFELPRGVKDRKRRIPGLTLEQVRYFERHGCFDNWRLKYLPEKDHVLVVWKPRRRGATALYTIHDLGIARLCAWMLTDEVPHRVIVDAIRGRAAVRITILAESANEVVVTRKAQAWGLAAS